MMKRLYSLLTFLLLSTFVAGQTGTNAKLSNSLGEADQLYTLINNANESINDNPTQAMDYIGQALALSYTLGNTRAEAFCYQTMGSINFEAGRYEVASEYFKKSIPLFIDNNEDKGYYLSLIYTASSLDALEQYTESLEYYNRYLEQTIVKNKTDDQAEAKAAIARIHYNQGNYVEAHRLYNEVRDYYEGTNQTEKLIDVTDDLGTLEMDMNLDTMAMNRFNETQQMSQEIGDNKRSGRSYSNIGKIFKKNNDPVQANVYEQQALTVNNLNGDLAASNSNNWNIAQNYISDNNPSEAIPYLWNTINLSNELGLLKQQGEALVALTDVYEEAGDYDNAIKAYRDYIDLIDSLKQIELEENLIALRLSSDLSQQEEHINLLERERAIQEQQIAIFESEQEAREAKLEQQQIISYSLGGGILVLGFSAFLVFRSSQQKRKANQLLALQSLRSQMNPHFIFNSLNSVNGFIARNDERSANKYLSEFSRLMRAVMENSKHDFVPLTSELDILRLYLDLEHLRFSDKFDFTFEVDPDLDSDMVQIPPMLIQPYIENSIWHGLRYLKDKGNLSVKFTQKESHVLVEILDDGIGRNKSQEIKTKNQKATKSTGMQNIEQRLNIINDLHNMQLKVEISDANPSAENPGTKVQIAVPLRSVEEEI